MNVSVLIKFSLETGVFCLNLSQKISTGPYVVDVYWSRLGEAILMRIRGMWFCAEILTNTTFYHVDTNPRFPPFLLYDRWRYGVTFVQRCFRDVIPFVTSKPILIEEHHLRKPRVLRNEVEIVSLTCEDEGACAATHCCWRSGIQGSWRNLSTVLY